MNLNGNQTVVLSLLQKMHDSGEETATVREISKALEQENLRSSEALVNLTLRQLLDLGLVSRSTPPPLAKHRGLRYKVTDKGQDQPCLSYKELYDK